MLILVFLSRASLSILKDGLHLLFRHFRSAELCEEPEERFIRVLQYYLAGWHIKPKGVKKP